MGCELGQPFGRAVSQFVFECQKGSPFDSAFPLLGTSAQEMSQPGTKDGPGAPPAWAIAHGSSRRAPTRPEPQRPVRWHHQPSLKMGISVCGRGKTPVICFGMNKVSHPRANSCFPVRVGLLPVCAVHTCVRVCTCVCMSAHCKSGEGVCSLRRQMEYVRIDGCPPVFLLPALAAGPTIFS